jgi:hypothetical protein
MDATIGIDLRGRCANMFPACLSTWLFHVVNCMAVVACIAYTAHVRRSNLKPYSCSVLAFGSRLPTGEALSAGGIVGTPSQAPLGFDVAAAQVSEVHRNAARFVMQKSVSGA